MLLARQGYDVALVDRATFPSDTLSTHALSRNGVVQLARWGLLDQVVASGAPPVRTVTFRIGDRAELTRAVTERAARDPGPVRGGRRRGPLAGRRSEDAALAAYAEERYRALAPIFDVTWRLAQYPPVREFVDLQKHLNDLTEAEADALVALPPLPRPARLVAA